MHTQHGQSDKTVRNGERVLQDAIAPRASDLVVPSFSEEKLLRAQETLASCVSPLRLPEIVVGSSIVPVRDNN